MSVADLVGKWHERCRLRWKIFSVENFPRDQAWKWICQLQVELRLRLVRPFRFRTTNPYLSLRCRCLNLLPVPMVPSISDVPSDPCGPAAEDKFPLDEQLSQCSGFVHVPSSSYHWKPETSLGQSMVCALGQPF
jgi:hypothetical protein